jgi:hypothetical protein
MTNQAFLLSLKNIASSARFLLLVQDGQTAISVFGSQLGRACLSVFGCQDLKKLAKIAQRRYTIMMEAVIYPGL